jgi:hypothetical protein
MNDLLYILEHLYNQLECFLFCGDDQFKSLIKVLLLFEVCFLMLITFLSLGIRLVRDHIRIKEEQFKNTIHRKIEKVLLGGRAPIAPTLNRKLRKPFILVPVLESFDHFHQSKRWSQLKTSIIEKYLLIKVHSYANSGNWKKRNFALRIYQLDLGLFPEGWVIDSLNDELPLNQIHAALCVGELGSKAAVNSLLTQLVDAGRFGRLAYEDALIQGNSDSLEWVKERYVIEEDVKIRRVCLDILSQKMEAGVLPHIIKDLKSDAFELKLAATRALGSQPSEESLVELSKLVKDESWVVRATTIKSLGRLGDQRIIPMLATGLRDSNWWVRLNSAMALLDMEELGMKVLKMQDPEIDKYAYQMARYILALK